MVDALPIAHPAQQLALLVPEVRRNQECCDLLADGFIGTVPEQPMRCPIPSLDTTIEARHEDRIVSNLDNRGEKGAVLLSLGPVRDILHKHGAAVSLAVI